MEGTFGITTQPDQLSSESLTSTEIDDAVNAGIDLTTLGVTLGFNVSNDTSDEAKSLRQKIRWILALLHLISPPSS